MIWPGILLWSLSMLTGPEKFRPGIPGFAEFADEYGQGILWIVRIRWSRCAVSCPCQIGKPTERSRPGNLGKRDSQMLMHSLTRFVFLTPLFSLQTHFTDSLQFANEPVRTWNVSSDQERYWSQSFILRVLIHGGCWYYYRWSFVCKPFDLSVRSVRQIFFAFTILKFLAAWYTTRSC